MECIDEVKSCGIIPKVITSDQVPSNIGCYNMLGVNVEGYFNSGGSRIYLLYVPIHLLKRIRNVLYSKGYNVNNNEIIWKHIVDLDNNKRKSKVLLDLPRNISIELPLLK